MALLLLLVGVGMTSTAQAATKAAGPDQARINRGMAVSQRVSAAKDPRAAYAALNAADKSDLEYVLKPVSVSVTKTSNRPAGVMRPASYNDCWEDYQNMVYSNVAGNALYAFWLRSDICAANGQVTDVWVPTAGGKVYPGWTYAWEISQDPKAWTKNAGWEGRSAMSIQFAYFFVDHYSYCLQNRQNGEYYGVYANSTSCDVNS
ncbi:hypothetical protein [Catenulispora yoronensis]